VASQNVHVVVVDVILSERQRRLVVPHRAIHTIGQSSLSTSVFEVPREGWGGLKLKLICQLPPPTGCYRAACVSLQRTIDGADDSKILNRIITTNRIPNRKFDSKSNRILKLRRSLEKSSILLTLIGSPYALSNEPKMNNVRCSCAPKGAWKRKTAVLWEKSYFAWRNSATKFHCVKTASDKVVRHSFAYLSVYKWLVGHVPFYTKIWRILTHCLAKRWFSIYFRS